MMYIKNGWSVNQQAFLPLRMHIASMTVTPMTTYVALEWWHSWWRQRHREQRPAAISLYNYCRFPKYSTELQLICEIQLWCHSLLLFDWPHQVVLTHKVFHPPHQPLYCQIPNTKLVPSHSEYHKISTSPCSLTYLRTKQKYGRSKLDVEF